MRSIKETIMERDGLSETDADKQIEEATEELNSRLSEDDIEGAYNICADYFGLEPDYINELY